MSSQPTGTPFQLPVGHTATAVLEGGLGTEAPGLLPEQIRQGVEGGHVRCHQDERFLWVRELP
ncbi:hypothetical protein [Streptomyces sp. NPDC055366]